MNSNFFKGKKVLITGASRGLGQELTRQLAQCGASVLAIARGKGNETTSQIETQACDVTDPSALDRLLRDREIDIAILNAGISVGGTEVFSFEKTAETLGVNLHGPLNCLKTLLPGMIRRGSGHLVFISSLGAFHGAVRANGYNASKAALSNIANSLRIDLASQGLKIRVTDVKPGLIDTGMIPQTRLAKTLAVKKSHAASKILKGIARGKKQITFPMSMYLLTLGMAAMPKGIQSRLLGRVK